MQPEEILPCHPERPPVILNEVKDLYQTHQNNTSHKEVLQSIDYIYLNDKFTQSMQPAGRIGKSRVGNDRLYLNVEPQTGIYEFA